MSEDTSPRLRVHPHCLMFFVDETGHEEMSDPNYPVFGFGGCAVIASVVDEVIRIPWRAMKAKHFGGPDERLHAAELRDIKPEQIQALGDYFRRQKFGRFAVTMTTKSVLPAGIKPLDVMPGALRNRWAELASRVRPTPVEIALIHEASERGDPLLERYFGPTRIHIEGQEVAVHHGLMPKASGDEALEVADFVAHTAGGQALHAFRGRSGFRKDFAAIFHANGLWSSFLAIDSVG